jgi:hypothetical protein
MGKLFRLGALAALISLSGCGKPEVVKKAEGEFASRNPNWKISRAFVGEGDPSTCDVHIHYIHTPAAVFPAQPIVSEMVMTYQRASNGWQLIQESGSKYIGPAP